MSGLLLNSAPPWNIKVGDDKVDYYTKSKKHSISYDTVRIFDSDKISGLNIKKHDVINLELILILLQIFYIAIFFKIAPQYQLTQFLFKATLKTMCFVKF